MSEFNNVLLGLGLGCCLSAAALYLLGRTSGRDAEVLKSVRRVHTLRDLARLLDIASSTLPLVVTVSGRVGADSPIRCKYSDLCGVIVEERVEQHFLKRTDNITKTKERTDNMTKNEKLTDKGRWRRDSELMLSTCKEVSWYLDDGTGRAYVVGARRADGLILTIGSEVFEEPRTSDCVQGLKMLGVKRIERVLPTGKQLTVVGEAVKDSTGAVRMKKPHNGPFYVSHETIDQLIANIGKWARFYRFASEGFAVLGVCLLILTNCFCRS